MSLLEMLAHENFFSVSKPLVKKIGFFEAGILQEIFSKYNWHDAKKKDFQGLYYKQEAMAEDFNTSIDTIKRTLKKLINMGLLRKVNRGIPCRSYYYIQEQNIIDLIESDDVPSNKLVQNALTGECKMHQLDSAKCTNIYIKKKEKKKEVEEETADFSYFSKSEEQIKKLEVVESDEIVTPPITFEETDDLLSLLTQYLPQVVGTPHCPEIIKILESKGEHKTPYLKFVAQNKAEKWFELAGWKNWFWQDYISNSYRTDDKKLIDKDEAEAEALKTEELNRKIEELKNKPFLEF